MPNFLIKSGHASSELRDWLKANEGKMIRIKAEVETPKDRLRGSFHALLTAWYNSGEYSHDCKTLEGLKRIFKLIGTDYHTESFTYKGDSFEDGHAIRKAYPNYDPNNVVRQPKKWEKMLKLEQCKALDTLISEINQSQTNNQKVLFELAKIQGDESMLKWLKWDKFQADKNYIESVKNKFE